MAKIENETYQETNPKPEPAEVVSGDANCSEYEPEFVVIRKDWIYSAQDSLSLGIEAMHELLANHDASIGRDFPRGKREAEEMEEEISKAESRLSQLNDFKFSHKQNSQEQE